MPLYCIPDVYCNLPFLEISSAYEGNDKSMTPHFVEEGWSYLNSDEVPKKWFDTPSLFHAGLESTCDLIYIPKNPLFFASSRQILFTNPIDLSSRSMSLRTIRTNLPLFRGLFTKSADVTKPVHTVMDFGKYAKGQEGLEIMTRSDKEMGGYSTVNFDIKDGIGHFHGVLNLDLPKDRPDVTRSGYAMFRTVDQKDLWLLGNSYWDWSNMLLLVLRVNGDRRKYLVNIQANTPLVTDLFQHRLFLQHPGEWETVVIPLNDFVMTNYGVIQDGSELNKAEVKTLGVGLLDKQYGPYSLKIDWIKVMTGAEVERVTKTSREERLPIEDEYAGSPGAAAFGGYKDEEPKSTIF